MATELATRTRTTIFVYEARRWNRECLGGRGCLEPIFYTRSEHDGPPTREDRAPESEVIGPPFSGPKIVRVIHPPVSNSALIAARK